jgi:hypothetical protein
MNLTLSVDDRIVEGARKAARAQGVSLNALVRRYLESLSGRPSPEEVVQKLKQLWEESPGNSQGRRIRREDAYAERLK